MFWKTTLLSDSIVNFDSKLSVLLYRCNKLEISSSVGWNWSYIKVNSANYPELTDSFHSVNVNWNIAKIGSTNLLGHRSLLGQLKQSSTLLAFESWSFPSSRGLAIAYTHPKRSCEVATSNGRTRLPDVCDRITQPTFTNVKSTNDAYFHSFLKCFSLANLPLPPLVSQHISSQCRKRCPRSNMVIQCYNVEYDRLN